MPTLTEPRILQRRVDADEAHYRLYLPPELIYFRGHFPDHPVLPGVVQVRWAIALAADLGASDTLEAMERLKFSRPMVPKLELELALLRARRAGIEFRYHDSGGNYSSGRLLLRPRNP